MIKKESLEFLGFFSLTYAVVHNALKAISIIPIGIKMEREIITFINRKMPLTSV